MTNLTAVPVTNSAITGDWDKSQLEIIKQQIAKGCSDGELALFAQVCRKTGLDPFTKQIYAISRNVYDPATKTSQPRLTIQVSIDGLRTQAARSGQYNGSQTFWCGSDGVWVDVWLSNTPPAAAKTIVRRGSSEFVGVAKFDSFVQTYYDKTTSQNKISGLWQSMPDVMIGKVSESQALRKGFPEQLSGLYTGEEMQQADNVAPLPTPEESPYKQATLDLFRKLGWSANKQKTWAAKINVMPSSKWSDSDWQNAAELLLKELESITVEAGND